MGESNWYVVHTYSGYENKVKADLEKTIENRKLHDQILEVAVQFEEVVEIKNGVKKTSKKKMYHMGISHSEVQVDFEEGDNVAVISGVWEGTVGTIQSINQSKQSVTIHVDMFGRETPVELNFTEVRKL